MEIFSFSIFNVQVVLVFYLFIYFLHMTTCTIYKRTTHALHLRRQNMLRCLCRTVGFKSSYINKKKHQKASWERQAIKQRLACLHCVPSSSHHHCLRSFLVFELRATPSACHCRVWAIERKISISMRRKELMKCT